MKELEIFLALVAVFCPDKRYLRHDFERYLQCRSETKYFFKSNQISKKMYF